MGITNAQTTTTVQGHVYDKDYPSTVLDGARVVATEKTDGTIFDVLTDNNGFYQGNTTATSIQDATHVASNYNLSQNYPDPYNPTTRINFTALKQGNYTLQIFEITGKKIFSKTYDLSKGTTTFNVAGLGAAGVKIYRIISNNFSDAKKMIQTDGTYLNPQVTTVSGGSNFSLGKTNNLETKLFASKNGYYPDSTSTSYTAGGTYTQDFSLSQIPKLDTLVFTTHQNMTPTNTPANGASITGKDGTNTIFSGNTDANGNFVDTLIVNYIANPSNPSEKKYDHAGFVVTVNRGNTTGATKTFTINGADINWNNNLQQTLISKNGTANGKIIDETSQPINGASAKVYNADTDSLFGQNNTNVSGDYQINYNYPGYENDALDAFTSVDTLRFLFVAPGKNQLTVKKKFSNNLTVNATLTNATNVDTILFVTHQNMFPTNTPADSAAILADDGSSTVFSGSTDVNGDYTDTLIISYTLSNNQKIYSPSSINVEVTRANTQGATKSFTINGADINWNNDLQQTTITKNGIASGNVVDDKSNPIQNAKAELYNNDNLLGQNTTNISGDYQVNYSYSGYENDTTDNYTNIDSLKFVFSVADHDTVTKTVKFVNPISVDAVLPEKQQTPYDLIAIIKLYDMKGDVVTDLDSLKFTWPDGTTENVPISNGVISLNKTFTTLNADTSATVTPNNPNLYLNWVIGTTDNANKVEWLYQNQTPWSTNNAKIPLNKINNKTTDEYLIKKFVKYGPNNDQTIDMAGATVTGFLSRAGIVSGFRPSPFDTTYVLQFTNNLSSGDAMPQNQLDRAYNELDKFLQATQRQDKKLLLYKFKTVTGFYDPFYAWISSSPRNQDNFTYTSFYNAGAGNTVNISQDGTLRIKNSNALYNINNTNGQIQEEIFASMLNLTIDDTAGYIYDVSHNYTSLVKNLIGISLIMKPGTKYYEQ